jgi:inorganic pyrophosphatase
LTPVTGREVGGTLGACGSDPVASSATHHPGDHGAIPATQADEGDPLEPSTPVPRAGFRAAYSRFACSACSTRRIDTGSADDLVVPARDLLEARIGGLPTPGPVS